MVMTHRSVFQMFTPGEPASDGVEVIATGGDSELAADIDDQGDALGNRQHLHAATNAQHGQVAEFAFGEIVL